MMTENRHWRNHTEPVTDPARLADNTTTQTLAILTLFHVVALIFVALRMYARAWVIKAFGKDDTIMGLAALFAIGGWAVFLFQAQHGLGRHQNTLTEYDLRVYKESSFYQSLLMTDISTGLTKISIGLNLLRLSNGTRWYFWGLWSIIGFISLYTVTYLVVQILHCRPVAGYWDSSINANCYSYKLFITLGIINTGFSVATDIMLAVIPIPIIWGLSLRPRVRFYLIGILSLGYLAVGVGIMKAVSQFQFASVRDKTYNLGVPFWGFLQLNLGMIAGCSTSLRPLASKMLGIRTVEDNGSATNYPSRQLRTISVYMPPQTRKSTMATETVDMNEGENLFDGDVEAASPDLYITRSPEARRVDDSSSEEEIIIQGANEPPERGRRLSADVSEQYHRYLR